MIELIELRERDRAAFVNRVVDRAVEPAEIAGDVGVPDFIISRPRRMAKRTNLANRHIGERRRAFVLVLLNWNHEALGISAERAAPCLENPGRI